MDVNSTHFSTSGKEVNEKCQRIFRIMKLAGILMVLFGKKENKVSLAPKEEQPIRHSEILRQRRMLQCENRMKEK